MKTVKRIKHFWQFNCLVLLVNYIEAGWTIVSQIGQVKMILLFVLFFILQIAPKQSIIIMSRCHLSKWHSKMKIRIKILNE